MSEKQRRKQLAAQIKALTARAERLKEHLERIDGVEDNLDSDDPEEFDEINRVKRERAAAHRRLDSTLEKLEYLRAVAGAMRMKREHVEARGKKQEQVEPRLAEQAKGVSGSGMSKRQKRKEQELAAEIKAVEARLYRLGEHWEDLSASLDVALEMDEPEEEIERMERERDAAQRYYESTMEELKRLRAAAEAMCKKQEDVEAMSEKQEHVEVAIEWPAGAPVAKQTMAAHPDYLVTLFGAVAFTVTLKNGERVRFVRDAAFDIESRRVRW